MKVIGVAEWPSTKALEGALREVVSDKVLYYGTAGRVDGLEQLQKFKVAGIPCPTFTISLAEAKGWVKGGKEVWGRKKNHTHGSDIIAPGRRRQWEASDFWVQRIPSTREFRQHIFDGKAIRIGEKVLTGEAWRKLLVRSRSNGWHIQYPPTAPPPEGLRDLAKKALAEVGYLFGAVDILLGEDGKLYVLEVNSAPSMGDVATLGAYVEAIKKWVKKS
jgi:hypothetical protein